MNHVTWLTPKEYQIIRELLNPAHASHKERAYALGISYGSLKVYIGRILRKLDWKPSQRTTHRLLLWAIAHHEELGVDLPISEQFKPQT